MTLQRELVVVIGPLEGAQRADKAIADAHPALSRRMVQALCERGRVLRAGRQLRKSDLLEAGDRVSIELDAPRSASPDPEVALTIRFESRDWIVLAKPGGQPSAPKHADDRGTLANGLLARFPELADVGYGALEPGLLHRLDNGTSGLLVAARHREAFRLGRQALTQGRWTKRYLALVQGAGLPEAGLIRGQLVPSRRFPNQVQLARSSAFQVSSREVNSPDADLSREQAQQQTESHETRFWVKRRASALSLVEISVSAAFRHQIRAHFAQAGWPLINDEIYGAAADPRLPRGRHALHAARVAWAGCSGFAGFDVFEPLPEDLAACLAGSETERE